MARIGVISLGILLALTIAVPSFEPAELIGLLGISSVAIGFAFRDILENFLAGLLILLTDPFKINDQIVVDGYEGTVEDIQMRATYVRTYDNRLVVIPNAKLFTGTVTVNTAYAHRRSEYDVGIGYESDIAAAQELMLRVMKNIEGVQTEPEPDAIMMEMGDSAIVIRVRWWTDARITDVLRVQDQVLRGIKDELTQQGFNIPFPIRTVYLNDMSRHIN
jgi:small-conductance mechanosensitive channel